MRRRVRAMAPRRGPAVVARGLLLGVLAAAGGGAPVHAQAFLSQEEALRLAFPASAVLERKTAYLSDADLEQARQLAGSKVAMKQAVVTYYQARVAGRVVGTAYFDAHRVRTLPEVLMVVVDTTGRIERVEVVKFAEPPEYLAPAGWLAQFSDRGLDRELSTKGAIANMTGATLTSRAVTEAARRVLALHRVIHPGGT